MRTLLVIMLLIFTVNIKAEVTPDKVVKDFGEAMSSWCNTDNIIYREIIERDNRVIMLWQNSL